jgi:Zn-dependent protease
MGGIGLPGGAVYIETWRLRSKRWEAAVALAGPGANLVMAVILSIVMFFTASTLAVVQPALAFLALTQISALVLNLIPVPPFDGYRALSPFLAQEQRARIDQYTAIITLAVFAALWYVPFINDLFWKVVLWILTGFRILPLLALQGLNQFQFWR